MYGILYGLMRLEGAHPGLKIAARLVVFIVSIIASGTLKRLLIPILQATGVETRVGD